MCLSAASLTHSNFTPGSVDNATAAMQQLGHNKWYKMFDHMQQQRMKQQKIQRLMLDTSSHGQTNFFKMHPEVALGAKVWLLWPVCD